MFEVEMIFGFRAKKSPILNELVDRWRNPFNPTFAVAKNTFVEFEVDVLDDGDSNIVLISQKHIFDVVAKTLVLGSSALMLLSYILNGRAFFIISSILCLVSILWLSKYFRYSSMVYRALRSKGYKGKIELLSEQFLIQRLLAEVKHGSE